MMKNFHRIFLFAFLVILLTNCTSLESTPNIPMPSSTETMIPTSTPEPLSLGAGFRFSTYGIGSNPGPEYWLSVGEQMSARFSGAHPETIWIVGNFLGDGKTYLNFHAETEDPNIVSGYVDMNEPTLNLFDENGFKVWLQVEPANADMITLIDLVIESI